MKKLIACICLFVNALAISAQDRSRVIVFEHANVIDGVSREPLRDVSVTIANGKITGIQKSLKRMPAGAEVIDLKGKWLLPGYIDAHVHIGDFESAQRALRFGVTTVRTMGGSFIDIEIRNAHRKGRTNIPEVLAAGRQVRPGVIEAAWFVEDFPELGDMTPPLSGSEKLRRLVKAYASKGSITSKSLRQNVLASQVPIRENEPSPTRN